MATKKSPPKKSSQRQLEDDLWGGRMLTALGFVVAMVAIPMSPLSMLITKTAPKSLAREQWSVGRPGKIHLTVVTSDFEKLACVLAEEHKGTHCAYKTEKELFPTNPDAALDDNKLHILQPYRTTDGQLVFLPGLWAQPEVATRLHNEPSRNMADKKLVRFAVACDVQFEAQIKNATVRWSQREAWSNQGEAFIAIPKKCEILREPTAS